MNELSPSASKNSGGSHFFDRGDVNSYKVYVHVCMLFFTSYRIMCYLQRKEILLEEYL